MNRKLVISALISAGGMVAAYVGGLITSGQLDLGVYGPLVGAVCAWLVNLARETATPAAPTA